MREMKSILIAVVIDLLIGDPYFFPHPVKFMGHIIVFEEKIIRRISESPKFLKAAGFFLVLINVMLAYFIPKLILNNFSGLFKEIIEIYFVYTCISARMLHYEAYKVKEALSKGLEDARNRLKYIVGRDTTSLNESEIVAATVETVAENTSDGVIAPLLYICALGTPFGFVYKFINTMDSMIGYKNEKYENLGYFPAKIDDLFNLIPARLTAYLMAFSSFFRFDTKRALKIIARDHGKHLSPNAGYPESAVAGLLGIRLGGGHNYFGKFVYKPYLGDEIRQISPKDIDNTVFIMYMSLLFFIVIYAGLYNLI